MEENMLDYKKMMLKCVYPLWWRLRYQLPWKVDFLLEKTTKRNNVCYTKLLDMKGKYKGNRCFIVGTGPSLKIEDLNAIKNEYSFSVNSILLTFPDTDWRPTFYAIQDIVAYDKLKEQIESSDLKYIFCGVSSRKYTPPIKRDHISYQLDTLDHAKKGVKFKYCFSSDAYDRVYDGFSITFSAIQLAVYLGFDEIVLLGVDCDYSKKVNHIKAYSVQLDKNAAPKMYSAFKCAREWADNNGVKILNATRNAKMDAFEIINLDDYLGRI